MEIQAHIDVMIYVRMTEVPHHHVQTDLGAHPAYLMGTRGSFPGGKVVEV
jgi:hypothetical protein